MTSQLQCETAKHHNYKSPLLRVHVIILNLSEREPETKNAEGRKTRVWFLSLLNLARSILSTIFISGFLVEDATLFCIQKNGSILFHSHRHRSLPFRYAIPNFSILPLYFIINPVFDSSIQFSLFSSSSNSWNHHFLKLGL